MNENPDLSAALSATIPPGLVYSFESQASQYPEKGPTGVTHSVYYETFSWRPEEAEIHALLYRNHKGRVIGILNYYPHDVPPLERAGNVNIWVHPRRQNRGIATRLLREALKLWPDINFTQQRYSPSGLAFIRSFLGHDPRQSS